MRVVVLTSAKRMGLSFSELARLDMPTFSAMCSLWGGGEAPDDAEHVREATQADIDRFF